VVVMLVVSVRRQHRLAAGITLVGLAVAGAAIPYAAEVGVRQVTALLVVDGFTLFYAGLLLMVPFVVTLLAYHYLDQRQEHREEFYILLLVATLGAMVLVASSHFVSLFLGLEILGVALYVLIAYLRSGRKSVEAGLKYLILAGASSAFLIFGMALVYAQLGTMELSEMAARLGDSEGLGLMIPGLALMLVGIGFKLAVVPFHMWTPDVYQGAPAPVTAFVATVSKGAMFALVLRYFTRLSSEDLGPIPVIFSVMAVASMLAGNLLALYSDNVKRILAYSSIAHVGYLLVAFLAGGRLGAEAVAFYLVAYFVTTLAAFGVVTVLSDDQREAELVQDYRGLFWRRPWLATLFTAALLSLAGIPLTAGFLGKFYVVAAGVDAARWGLVFVLILGSAIGLFYYLRIVVAMLTPADTAQATAAAPRVLLTGGLALAVLGVSLVWLGIYPAPLVDLIAAVVRG
jgi:NADH-quinone oxidoreductase subunit N